MFLDMIYFPKKACSFLESDVRQDVKVARLSSRLLSFFVFFEVLE